jgi:glucose-6-phosphate isomerase
MLVANALAQAAVLSLGRTAAEVAADGTPADLVPHKVMPGNRPVSVVMVPRLTPRSLGALVALYEHSVFTQGAVWGIDSFDQWGVELGKKTALGILADITDGRADDASLDPATRASIAAYLSVREA